MMFVNYYTGAAETLAWESRMEMDFNLNKMDQHF